MIECIGIVVVRQQFVMNIDYGNDDCNDEVVDNKAAAGDDPPRLIMVIIKAMMVMMH